MRFYQRGAVNPPFDACPPSAVGWPPHAGAFRRLAANGPQHGTSDGQRRTNTATARPAGSRGVHAIVVNATSVPRCPDLGLATRVRIGDTEP